MSGYTNHQGKSILAIAKGKNGARVRGQVAQCMNTPFRQSPSSNFHTVVINLEILENFGKFWIFSGRVGPRGGRKRILFEKSLPKVGSRLESVPWGPVSWPISVFGGERARCRPLGENKPHKHKRLPIFLVSLSKTKNGHETGPQGTDLSVDR